MTYKSTYDRYNILYIQFAYTNWYIIFLLYKLYAIR